MLLLSLCLLSPASAADWFYPGRGDHRLEIDADGFIDGMAVQRTGRVLVRADDPATLAALPAVVSVERLAGHAVLLHLDAGTDELALSRQLHDRADVQWAHPDLVLPVQPQTLPDDPLVADQWHLENTGQDGWTPGVDIDAETAWAVSTGQGVLIAVLDGGVEVDHPDLDGIAGWDYVDGDADPYPDPESDSAAHGTCAAGIAAAVGDNGLGVAGVAYDAQVYGIRLLGEHTTTADLYDAFIEAADAGADVLSNSWGFDNGCSSYTLWGSVADALDYVEAEGRGGLGAVVVVSAGNGDCNNSGDGFLAHQAVISVAASDGNDEREWYSSYGDVVDITGPSGAILTTDLSGEVGYGSYNGDPDYVGSFSGTSASAPVVSGVVGLMLAANPRLTAAQVREVLCETAEPIDVDNGIAGYNSDGWSPWYGCGRVDAGAAVLAVANTTPDAPVLTWPIATASEDRVMLQWTGSDLDDDRLRYRVTWSIEGQEDTVVEVDGDRLDLSAEVAVDDVVSWSVEAIDLWGEGPSAAASFQVVAAQQEPTAELPVGCSAAPALGGLFSLSAGLLGLLGFRRRPSSSR